MCGQEGWQERAVACRSRHWWGRTATGQPKSMIRVAESSGEQPSSEELRRATESSGADGGDSQQASCVVSGEGWGESEEEYEEAGIFDSRVFLAQNNSNERE